MWYGCSYSYAFIGGDRRNPLSIIRQPLSVIRAFPGLTITAFLAFIVLISLGTWQVYRLQWKTALIAEIGEGIAAPAVPLPRDVTLAKDQFKKVKISGIFLHNKEIHIAAKYYKGQAGYYILTPLKMPDGRVALINRGWVPEDKINWKSRPKTLVAGKVTLEGIIFPPFLKHWFMPKNSPEKNIWFSTDAAEINDYVGATLPGYIIQQISPNPGQLPIPLDTQVKLRNDHLGYAITWYSLALTLAVIYFLFIRNERKKHEKLSGT